MERLSADPASALRGWTLAGGAGLALRLGHRYSDDLDFFRNDPIDIPKLLRNLRAHGECEVWQEDADTQTVRLAETKCLFFLSRGRSLFIPCGVVSGFFLADPRDIGLMKPAAVSGRGARKVFVDLFVLLRSPPSLRDYFEWLPKKYGPGRADAYHILKSLVYFDDAEREPMPRMRIPFDWNECRHFFEREARRIILDA